MMGATSAGVANWLLPDRDALLACVLLVATLGRQLNPADARRGIGQRPGRPAERREVGDLRHRVALYYTAPVASDHVRVPSVPSGWWYRTRCAGSSATTSVYCLAACRDLQGGS